jgi:transposase, IS30 family
VPAYVCGQAGLAGRQVDWCRIPTSSRLTRNRHPRFYWSKQRLVHKVVDMHLSSSSAAGVRFLTSVREGRGLNRSAREAGVGKETGYRWLREAYVAHRRSGKSIAETEAVMGLASAKSIAWEAEVAAAPGRHHLRVAVDTEARFWAVYDAGTSADAAASAAGVGRSTGYRWLDRRFCELRAAGFTVKGAQRLLRLTDQVTARAEGQRAAAKLGERQAAAAAHEEALRSSRGVSAFLCKRMTWWHVRPGRGGRET